MLRFNTICIGLAAALALATGCRDTEVEVEPTTKVAEPSRTAETTIPGTTSPVTAAPAPTTAPTTEPAPDPTTGTVPPPSSDLIPRAAATPAEPNTDVDTGTVGDDELTGDQMVADARIPRNQGEKMQQARNLGTAGVPGSAGTTGTTETATTTATGTPSRDYPAGLQVMPTSVSSIELPNQSTLVLVQEETPVMRTKVCVDPTGKVTDVTVVQSSGFAKTDREAVKQLRTWAFEPMDHDGKAVAYCELLTFKLQSGGWTGDASPAVGRWAPVPVLGESSMSASRSRSSLVTVDRRRFLRMSGAAAVGLPLIGACGFDGSGAAIPDGDGMPGGGMPGGGMPPEELAFDPMQVPLDAATFPSALIAGEMKPTSLMLAGYFADRMPKTLRVWRPAAADGKVLMAHDTVVEPDDHGYVKQAVGSLEPGAWYSYAFFDGERGDFASRSEIAQVRTALSDDSLEPLTVAIGACNGGKAQPGQPPSPFTYRSFETTAREEYDLFIHLGDQAYMDDVFAAGGSRAQYAEAWQWYLRSAGMRQSYARSGMYVTWDDHEVVDNGKLDPWTMTAADVARIRNAKESFYRAMPIDATTADDRLWRAFRWGKVAEFILLDCRYERNPPSTSEYISRAQMDFLKERLASSPCHFKVVANSVPITNMPFPWSLAKNDRWEGYPEARAELLAHINEANIENVWFLAGDFHLTFASRLETGGSDLASRTREIAITSGNSAFVPPSGPNFDYMSAQPRACLLTFDPIRNSVYTRFLHPDTGEEVWAEELRQD